MHAAYLRGQGEYGSDIDLVRLFPLHLLLELFPVAEALVPVTPRANDTASVAALKLRARTASYSRKTHKQ